MNSDDKLITVRNLCKYFPLRGGIFSKVKDYVRAVDDVSFSIRRGETFGLVGESGSGKTTVGRTLLKLIEPTSGDAFFEDKNIYTIDPRQLRELRRKMQIIFQDPASSLNPRMTVERIVGEGIVLHRLVKNKAELRERVAELLLQVGLSEDYLQRYPHEFSGGQRQRIGIARALALKPEFIVADEPVSALDVSIQSQILNLLDDLKEQYNLSFLFIAHNLAVVEHFCDNVSVMYRGKIVELATATEIYRNPMHPYTKFLIQAVPNPEPSGKKTGKVRDNPMHDPEGHPFSPNCPYTPDECSNKRQKLLAGSSGKTHELFCWKHDENEKIMK